MNLRQKFFLMTLVFLSASAAFGKEWYLELDQMLSLKAGIEKDLGDRWGVKGSVGIPLVSLSILTYDFAGYYRLVEGKKHFRLSTEFGLNVGCVSLIEGTLVDWDSTIDEPFAGFGPGINLNWGYAFKRGALGLKTGLIYYHEYKAESRWREPIFLPEISLEYHFSPS